MAASRPPAPAQAPQPNARVSTESELESGTESNDAFMGDGGAQEEGGEEETQLHDFHPHLVPIPLHTPIREFRKAKALTPSNFIDARICVRQTKGQKKHNEQKGQKAQPGEPLLQYKEQEEQMPCFVLGRDTEQNLLLSSREVHVACAMMHAASVSRTHAVLSYVCAEDGTRTMGCESGRSSSSTKVREESRSPGLKRRRLSDCAAASSSCPSDSSSCSLPCRCGWYVGARSAKSDVFVNGTAVVFPTRVLLTDGAELALGPEAFFRFSAPVKLALMSACRCMDSHRRLSALGRAPEWHGFGSNSLPTGELPAAPTVSCRPMHCLFKQKGASSLTVAGDSVLFGDEIDRIAAEESTGWLGSGSTISAEPVRTKKRARGSSAETANGVTRPINRKHASSHLEHDLSPCAAGRKSGHVSMSGAASAHLQLSRRQIDCEQDSVPAVVNSLALSDKSDRPCFESPVVVPQLSTHPSMTREKSTISLSRETSARTGINGQRLRDTDFEETILANSQTDGTCRSKTSPLLTRKGFRRDPEVITATQLLQSIDHGTLPQHSLGQYAVPDQSDRHPVPPEMADITQQLQLASTTIYEQQQKIIALEAALAELPTAHTSNSSIVSVNEGVFIADAASRLDASPPPEGWRTLLQWRERFVSGTETMLRDLLCPFCGSIFVRARVAPCSCVYCESCLYDRAIKFQVGCMICDDTDSWAKLRANSGRGRMVENSQTSYAAVLDARGAPRCSVIDNIVDFVVSLQSAGSQRTFQIRLEAARERNEVELMRRQANMNLLSISDEWSSEQRQDIHHNLSIFASDLGRVEFFKNLKFTLSWIRAATESQLIVAAKNLGIDMHAIPDDPGDSSFRAFELRRTLAELFMEGPQMPLHRRAALIFCWEEQRTLQSTRFGVLPRDLVHMVARKLPLPYPTTSPPVTLATDAESADGDVAAFLELTGRMPSKKNVPEQLPSVFSAPALNIFRSEDDEKEGPRLRRKKSTPRKR